MIVYNKEDLHENEIPCYPDIDCMYQTISMEVREHMERVGKYAADFTDYLMSKGLNQEDLDAEFLDYCQEIYTYHDIGRALVPVRVLNKAGGLTDEEFQLIKEHPAKTELALNALYHAPYGNKLMNMLYNVGTYHHERFDGNGYPKGLAGKKIPYEAAICSLADAYDGMTSWKPYRQSMPKEQVKKIIEEEAGKQFDPKLAHYFIDFMDNMLDNDS